MSIEANERGTSDLHAGKTVIIGGGAAGLMAGFFSAKAGSETVILEKNPKVGRKLMITGKGRCNLTNNCDSRTVIANTPTGGRFLFSALSAFSPQDTMEFFRSHGLELKTERGNRVFPVSDKAADVVDTLLSAATTAGCRIINRTASELITEDGRVTGVICDDGSRLECDRLIIATGGLSYPLTGSTGDGYRFARSAGHTVTPLRPSLVPLVTEEHLGYDSDGLLLKNIAITVTDTKKKKVIYTDFGELELKRWGLSGAVIRSASAHIREPESGRFIVSIDLKPALSEEKLDARLQRETAATGSGSLRKMLGSLMPSALIEDFVRFSDIDGEKRCSDLTRQDRRTVLLLLKNMKFTVKDFRPIEEAIVTSGGVSTKEIDPKTMQSKLMKGLFFAGEIIDYDCYTGGFNLQAAFATGAAAGRSILINE